ncbi:hypothetical protein BK816_00850 [Boudabousia tangfeifanii]|uniref:Uncharacterized protein n=1 Tax=Boudabousia tangfeifanii TaxID=1912795 RepID=A0A1D9MI64_9ACTO|nr:hypothetical protein BK816_00850 [Boudabousia tangfeifanii]
MGLDLDPTTAGTLQPRLLAADPFVFAKVRKFFTGELCAKLAAQNRLLFRALWFSVLSLRPWATFLRLI